MGEGGQLEKTLIDLRAAVGGLEAASAAVQRYDLEQNAKIVKVLDQLDSAPANLERFTDEFNKHPIKTLSKGTPPQQHEAEGDK